MKRFIATAVFALLATTGHVQAKRPWITAAQAAATPNIPVRSGTISNTPAKRVRTAPIAYPPAAFPLTRVLPGTTYGPATPAKRVATVSIHLPAIRDAVPIYPHPQRQFNAMMLDVMLGREPTRMLLDTGASLCRISSDLGLSLVVQGDAVLGPVITVMLADGSEVKMPTVTIHEVKIGTHVVRSVKAGMGANGDMLLGLPVLNQIGTFTIDVKNQQLVFN